MRKSLLTLLLCSLPAVAAGCASAESEAETASDAVTAEVVRDIGSKLEGATGATVLTGNEDSFAAKLAVIDGAKRGDTLDVSYYIFSDDESAAFYATRLVAAAKRGVKVRVMLDYLTNFSRYHYFKAIQDEAGGPDKIEFRFYNKPNANIVEDVKFLVTPCSLENTPITAPACTADRRANAGSPASEAKSKVFLSGLYSKNAAALQVSMGEVLAQYQSLQESAATTSDADRAQALAGLKLVFDAKVKGDVGAMLLVFFAGDKLAPINEMWAALVPAAANEHARDWQHLTDFTHQKLTLKTSPDGSAEVVVGGRNIENSYHLSELPPESGSSWKKKYVFMDVDMHATFARGSKIRERFAHVWNFDAMVATMGDDLEDLTPPNLQIPVIEDGQPVAGKTAPVLTAYSYADIETAAARFTRDYATYDAGKLNVKYRKAAFELAQAGQFPTFDASADPNAEFYYFDNVHNPGGERVFGGEMKYGTEKESGKEIQELWVRSLKDLCKNGDGRGGKAEIVFHNAYLSLPGRLQYELFERTRLLGNGTRFECENGVSQVKIITNSRESTDLNVVNIYNEAWMKPTMEVEANRAPGARFLQYREYKTHEITAKNPIARSLHAKVMIFGDDIFIGSANADGRSEFMDTNNGIFIRNAPKLSKAYREWLTDVIEPDLVTGEDPRQLRSRTIDEIAADNAGFLSGGLRAKGHGELVTSMVDKRIKSDTRKIYETAARCLPAYDKACISKMDQLLQPF